MEFLHNILHGASTVLELFPSTESGLPTSIQVSQEDDANALRGDWLVVGDDISKAYEDSKDHQSKEVC